VEREREREREREERAYKGTASITYQQSLCCSLSCSVDFKGLFLMKGKEKKSQV
jgi:hypothetical protein